VSAHPGPGRDGDGDTGAHSPIRIDAEALRRALPYADAVDILESAFSADAGAAVPARRHLRVPGGEMLLMPAFAGCGVGVKLVTIARENRDRGLPLIQGVYVLFAAETLAPRAIIDAAALTAVRTAAVSALATRYLARPDARRLVVFGGGAQAAAHVDAMRAVRPIDHVAIVGTGSERTRRLVERIRREGLAADLASPEAVGSADIVCTCTTSATPVFEAGALARGAHVNAVGAYRSDLRELPAQLLRDTLLTVETREAALAEAGDIVLAIDEGHLTADDIAGDLHGVVSGAVTRPPDGEGTSVFKSVGLALEDLVLAHAAAGRLGTSASDDVRAPAP
jgi:ornithine cyclodeaminase/alanine dehydrogenase-like protein (mu-crystallin family)